VNVVPQYPYTYIPMCNFALQIVNLNIMYNLQIARLQTTILTIKNMYGDFYLFFFFFFNCVLNFLSISVKFVPTTPFVI
jgi:hypothetical protein